MIVATKHHPFWSVDLQKWINAGELIPDSVLMNIYEDNITVQSILHYEEDKTVYNLTIDKYHTYFVGNNKILSHNASNQCPLFRNFYRGGPQLEVRPVDVILDSNGRIKKGGASININPNDKNVVGFGGAYEVYLNSIPAQLGYFSKRRESKSLSD